MNIIINTHNTETLNTSGMSGGKATGLNVARDQYLLEELLGAPRRNPDSDDYECWDVEIICPQDGELGIFQIYRSSEDEEAYTAGYSRPDGFWKFLDLIEAQRKPILTRSQF